MAAEDDGPNFSYAFGDAPSWNPALRPDHESPRKQAFDHKEVGEPITQQVQDEDDLPESAGPVQSASSWAAHPHVQEEEAAIPPSDDDFFDRYRRPEPAPEVPFLAQSESSVNEISRSVINDAHTAPAEDLWGNDELDVGGKDASWMNGDGEAYINGTRQEPVEIIAEKHGEPDFEIDDSQDLPVERRYEHQGEDADVSIDSGATPLVEDGQQSQLDDAWGASDEWQIDDSAPFAVEGNGAATAYDPDADEQQLPQQPDISTAVFSADETSLSTQNSNLAVDNTLNAEEEILQDVSRPTETPTAVPQAAQESSQDEWGATDDDPFNFDGGVAPVEASDTVVAKSEDLADAWAAAMGDDEFLDDEAKAAFDFDDDEDFSVSTQVAPEPVPAPVAIINRHKRSSSTAKYTPANVPQSGMPPPRSASYRPDGPQFTDLSEPAQGVTSRSQTSAVAAHPAAYNQSTQRPPLPAAESFADKAKSGYHSPYDLPEDLSVRRRRPAVQARNSTPIGQQTVPPPRLSSMQNTPTTMAPPLPSPGFPGPSPVSSQAPYQSSAPPTQSSKPPARDSGFFADLPVGPRPPRQGTPSRTYSPQPGNQPPPLAPPAMIRPASTSYNPSPTQQQPPVLTNMPQLRPAERMPLYPDEPQNVLQPPPVPPPSSSRYSPAVPPAPATARSSYSPAPPPSITSNSSRYSPAPGTKIPPNAATRTPSDAGGLPRVQAQAYAPRTSSPLAQHHTPTQSQSSVITPPQSSSQPEVGSSRGKVAPERMGSMVSLSGLETVNENAEPMFSPPSRPEGPRQPLPSSSRGSTPPPPPKSQPSSTFSSPRKRSSYAPSNYQPMSAPLDQSIVPPRRSQTSSPGSAIKIPHMPMANLERPASVAAFQSPVQGINVKQTNRMTTSLGGPIYHEMDNLVHPQDPSVQDPLQRWKGAPIFKWGNGDAVVTSFPKYMPLYGGPSGSTIKPVAGETKSRNLSSLCPQSDIFMRFPGPLKKGKKREILVWLKNSVDQMEADHKQSSMNGEFTTALFQRSEERLLLWKVMSLFVEHDGVLEGTSIIDAAVRALIDPATPEPVSATDDPDRPAHQPEAFDPFAVKALRTHLYAGERDKAVWHAVDQRLWAHALLIASTLNDKDIWKQVVREFVRKEVRKTGENTEALAALYQVFAGNWEESIDELVSVSARSGFQMVNTATGSASQKDALAGLDKWRETLLLVLNNRSVGDVAALASLGNLLNGYGRVEAGHICFLFAKSAARFGGADVQDSHFSLIGGSAAQQGSDFGKDLDTILLSEVYEFVVTTSSAATPPIPHLQAYKLYHAEVLAEAGKRSEAQQYCDAITNIATAKSNRSPYYNAQLYKWLDDFARRLSQAPADRGDSSWKPSINKVSSSIWSKFNNFVAGESETPENAGPGPISGDANFTPVSAQMPPPVGRTVSASDVYSGYQANGMPAATPPSNSRYAPGSTYGQRSSSEQQRPKYTPGSQSAYEPRASMESSRSVYEPRSSNEYGSAASPQWQATPGSSHSAGSQYTPGVQQAAFTPSSYTPDHQTYQAGAASGYVPSPLQHATPDHNSGYLPSPPVELHYGQNGYDPASGGLGVTTQSADGMETYQPQSSNYEPPGFQSSQGDDDPLPEDSEDEGPKTKKKSFMDDDDDDDILARAAALKSSQKSDADRKADEAFRKAAEADAAKDKTGSAAARGSWFGGWFGGKKDPNAPTVHKAKLGDESSFYYDKDLGRWINKKGGADANAPVAPTPPPPKMSGPPSRPPSGMMPPPAAATAPPTTSSRPGSSASAMMMPPPSSTARGVSPARTDSPASVSSAPPLQPPSVAALSGAGGPPSRPPSRPTTSMSNASDIDDLLGPAAPRKAGAKKAGARKGRYVDVMANKS